MFFAQGIGAKRDGATLVVRVGIYDERQTPPALLREDVFRGATMAEVRLRIDTALQALKDAEDDQTLTQQIAGKVLSRA